MKHAQQNKTKHTIALFILQCTVEVRGRLTTLNFYTIYFLQQHQFCFFFFFEGDKQLQ